MYMINEYGPPGARWLISEHRRCIAELKRIKGMITDLAKYIATLSGKGKNIMEAYLSLNRHLDELRTQIDQLANENSHHKVSNTILSPYLQCLADLVTNLARTRI